MIDTIRDFFSNACNVSLKEVQKPFYTEVIAGDSIDTLLGHAVIVAFVAIFVLFLFTILPNPFKNGRMQRIRAILFYVIFAMTWTLGFAVYAVGMYIEGGIIGLLRVAPMAMVHAFGMFVFDSDVSEVHDYFFKDLYYMTWFSLAHFLAALLSLIFILRYIGFYITARIRLKWKSVLAWAGLCRPRKLNVFWGINKDSLLLAENIRTQKKEDVVFVRILGDEESQTSQVAFGRVLNIIRLNDSEINNLRRNGYYVTSLFRNMVNDAARRPFSIADTLGLSSLNRLLTHTVGNVNIFLFDDIDSTNINNLISLVRDSRLSGNKKVHFFIKARQSAANDIIGHTLFNGSTPAKACSIHLVDTAFLSVADMMRTPESHPVNVVDVEKDCTVSSRFDALLVGFGQTGENAFRYLYEFSAFSGKEMRRSECRFTIIDKEASQRWNAFTATKPDLEKSSIIDTVDAEIGSAKYWDTVKKRLNDLNYVVIAAGNDEENLNAAIELYRMAVKERQTLDKLLIYFRIYSAGNEDRIQRIVKGFNDVTGKDVLRTFGSEKTMVSYDNIVAEQLLEEAKTYNARYEGKTEDEKDALWDKLSAESLFQKNHKCNPAYTYMAAIAESINKREQNISNSQHRHTKTLLMGEDFMKALPGIDRKYKTVNYEGLTAEQVHVMNIMACTEHLRWIAKQELLGYQYGAQKDYVRMTHPCMVAWNDKALSDEVRSWDCNVVDTSIKMYIW